MRKSLLVAIATAALTVPSVSFADGLDNFLEGKTLEQRVMLGASTISLMTEAKKMGLDLDASTLPGYVMAFADEDKDGKLNDTEFTRAEKRIRSLMIGGDK